MRTPQAEKTAVNKPSKEKKQLMMLGVLGVVLVIVLSVQFSGAEGEEAQAGTQPEGEVAAAAGGLVAAQPAGLESSIPDNPVLASTSADQGIKSNPFESFWNTEAPAESTTIDELPPPSVTLNGTLTSGRKPVAVIDGQTRYLGDMISGWRLVGIGSRRVNLESPTKSLVTIEMPLLRAATKRRP